MKLCFGPWVWQDKDPAGASWRSPVGAVSIIDTRSIPDHAQDGGGFGVFAFADDVTVPSDYRLLGSGPSLKDIVPKGRKVFADALKVKTVTGSTADEWLYTLLTEHSDPSGDTAVRPLMPTKALDMHAFGLSRKFDLNHAHAKTVMAVMHGQYRSARQLSHAGHARNARSEVEPNLHRKMLDMWGHQFGVDPEIFIPGDLPKETRVKHSTTLQDDFNRADTHIPPGAGGLGTATGTNGGWTWTVEDLSSVIESNKANNEGIAFSCYASTDMSSANFYSQCKIVTDVLAAGGSGQVHARRSSAAYTCYEAIDYNNGNHYFRSVIAGTPTEIGASPYAGVTGANNVLKLDCNGSTITSYRNGVSVYSGPDTAVDGSVVGGLRAGIKLGAFMDDFIAADGLGGPADTLFAQACF